MKYPKGCRKSNVNRTFFQSSTTISTCISTRPPPPHMNPLLPCLSDSQHSPVLLPCVFTFTVHVQHVTSVHCPSSDHRRQSTVGKESCQYKQTPMSRRGPTSPCLLSLLMSLICQGAGPIYERMDTELVHETSGRCLHWQWNGSRLVPEVRVTTDRARNAENSNSVW